MDEDKTDNIDEVLQDLARWRDPIETQDEWQQRVSTENFKTTETATSLWLSENKDLCGMHARAVEDYITARHTVLELGLFKTGLALAAQAIEKYLKCYLLSSGMTTKETGKYRHKVNKLMNDAHKLSNQDALLNYSDFCTELEGWYNSRYPDAKNPSLHWMRSAISKLDDFAYHLEEHMPIPPNLIHLKYAGGNMGHQWSSIFVRLFVDVFSQHRTALFNENAVLHSRISELEKKFFKHRLAATLPAKTLNERIEHSNNMDAVLRKYEDNETQTE